MLSPLLFVLVVDALSAMCSHALSLGILTGVPLGDHGTMCHLQYADDLQLLSTGGIEDLRIFKLILLLFKRISGLAINFQNSFLYTTAPGSFPAVSDALTLNFSQTQLSILYMGVSLLSRRPRKQD